MSIIETEREQPPFPPLLVLAGGLLAVAASAILIRWAQGEAPSLVIAAWRTGAATLLLLPFTLARRREELRRMPGRDWLLAALAGGLLGVHFASWISSLEFTSVASSTVLVTTNPIWVALAAPFFLNERLTRPLQIGIGLAVAGSLVITAGDAFFGGGSGPVGQNPLLGNGLALLGAITAAAYFIIGRRLRPRLSLLSYTTVVYGAAGLSLVLAVWFSGQRLLGYSPQVYLLLLLMAIFPQLIGHSSFNYALRFLPAAYVSVAVLGEPIGASILAFIILRELPASPLLALIGAILIFVGILFAGRPPTSLAGRA